MNLKLFKKRLVSFYSSWRTQKRDLWGNSDVLVICTPHSDSSSSSTTNPCHPVSSSFFFWLMGHDFHDTIAIFTRNNIYFLCTKKRFFILQTLVGPAMEAVCAQVRVYPKNKDDNGLELMDGIIRGIRVTYKLDENRPLVVGYVSGESPKSKLLWGCFNNKKPKKFRSVHVSGYSRLLNHEQDVRFAEKFGEKRDLELFEQCNSRVGFGSLGKCEDNIPMQSLLLPAKFEQMLSLSNERIVEAPSTINDKRFRLEKGKGNPPAIKHQYGHRHEHKHDVGKKSAQFLGLLNRDQHVKFAEEFGERMESELFEKCNSRVDFGSHGNCEDIPMQSLLLPNKFEQMLSLTHGRIGEAPRKVNDNKLQLEKGKGDPPVIIHEHIYKHGHGHEHDMREKYVQPEDLEGSSSEYTLVSCEDDEWVLVEDDDREQCIGR